MVTDGTCDQSFRLSSRVGLPVVTTPAEIDFRNAAQLGEVLASASMDHATVIVDMSANVLCDSSGLAEFIKALKRAQAAGGELRLVMCDWSWFRPMYLRSSRRPAWTGSSRYLALSLRR
jgi:anti-anti-sigma factor